MAGASVFISYSHKDEDWKDRLVTHLRVLEMEDILDVWEDRRIEAGDDWKPEIENAIGKASVAVLLVSANFLTSKFILGEEVPKLLERREKEGVRVIPVIVKPCAWTHVKWLSPIQARPRDGRPLSGGNENQIDTDLAVLADDIARFVQNVKGKLSDKPLARTGLEKISDGLAASVQSKALDFEKRIKDLINFENYAEAYKECETLFLAGEYFPLLDLLAVISILRGQAIERLNEEKVTKAQKYLLRASGYEETRATALLLLGFIKYDYYYVHGEYEREPTIVTIRRELGTNLQGQIRNDLLRDVKVSEPATRYFEFHRNSL